VGELMLGVEEISRISEMFGVSASQVRRDYLIWVWLFWSDPGQAARSRSW
jgi:hypothetical protein